MSNEITIVIADDHPIYRKGLWQILGTTPGLRVVGEADNGAAALELIRAHRPRVAMLNPEMPGKDGFDVTRTIVERGWPVEVVFMAVSKSEKLFNAALDLGVKGFVLKESKLEEILNCIRSAASGESFVSPVLASYLLNRSRRAEAGARSEQRARSLTPTERRILSLIAEHRTNKEIAERLFVSVRTIENHRHNISQKLNLRGAHALLKFALDHMTEI